MQTYTYDIVPSGGGWTLNLVENGETVRSLDYISEGPEALAAAEEDGETWLWIRQQEACA